MKLINTKYNPVPPNPTIGSTHTLDGVELRYAHWKTLTPPTKGTVLLLGGRAEFIEKQFETISNLRENGFDVLCFDWRGQGGSSRLLSNPRKGFIENFDQYVIDLDTIITDVALPDCRAPFFILGHSTGALVALLASPQLSSKIQRMVLASPMLGLGKTPLSQTVLKYVTGALHVVGLGKLFVAGGSHPDQERTFIGNKLTSDTKRFERNSTFAKEFPKITIGGPTASWVFAACRAMDKATDQDFYSTLSVPTLMICAGADRVVDNSVAEYVGKRMRSGKMLTISGAKHELLTETDLFREQLLAAFYAFVPGSTRKTKTVKKEKKSFFQRIKSA